MSAYRMGLTGDAAQWAGRKQKAHNAVTLVHFKRQNRSAFTPLTKAKPPPAYILKFPLLMGRLLFKYSFRIGAAYKIPNLYVSSIEGRPTQRQIGLSLC
jgi:hypothetical protein